MLLFSVSFLVMETSTSEGSQDQACSHTPTMMDEAMATIHPLANLVLTEEEISSDLVDRSIMQKQGIIIQILNNSCAGSSTVIGGIRINLTDVRKIPAYLSRNRRLIKQHAVRIMMKHYQDMNYGLGAAETLHLDDFGLSFTLASVSHEGSELNPGRRKEGPLFCCHFPVMVSPIVLQHAQWDANTEGVAVHVVNAYVNILPLHQRRNYIVTKAREDKTALEAAQKTTQPYVPAKKSKASPPASSSPATKGTPNNQERKPQLPETAALREEIARLKVLTNRLQQQALPSPPLPVTKPPVWPTNRDQGPDLPDDL